jgi:hypothetical protein
MTDRPVIEIRGLTKVYGSTKVSVNALWNSWPSWARPARANRP